MKYRDFSDMPADKLRAFADALADIARKAQEKASKKRRIPFSTLSNTPTRSQP